MRRGIVIAAIVLVVLAGVWNGHPLASVSAADGKAISGAKKKCTVKIVKGKKRTVCTAAKKPKPTATPLPTDVQAKQLAATLAQARTPEARYAGLLAVMQALHVGVYDARTGDALVRGSERSIQDFFLYDYELKMLASALGDGDTYTISNVATLLTAAGIKPAGKDVDPEAVRTWLVTALGQAVTHPSDHSSMVRLLIRELGLQHTKSYDLATDVPATQVQFDPLQFFLIEANFLAPLIHTAAGSAGSRLQTFQTTGDKGLLGASCVALRFTTTPANPNTLFDSKLSYPLDDAIAYVIKSLVQEFVDEAAAEGLEYAELAYVILSGLHGMLLADGIRIESLPPSSVDSHYGPAGHFTSAGTPFTLKVKVYMRTVLPDDLLRCLKIAGFEVPKAGPVSDVEVKWEDSFVNLLPIVGAIQLEKYGTVSKDPADGKTGEDGIASLSFTPKDEPFPGLGAVITQRGGLAPRALWASAFDNVVGTVSQLVTPKYGAEFFWNVTYHKPRGFKFDKVKLAVIWHPTLTGGDGTGGGCSGSQCYGTLITQRFDYTISGRVCGDTPYVSESDGWQLEESAGNISTGTTGMLVDGPTTSTMTWGANKQGLFYEGSDYSGRTMGLTGGDLTARIVVGPPAQVTFHLDTNLSPYGYYTVESADTVAPLQEDMSCPDNSDIP